MRSESSRAAVVRKRTSLAFRVPVASGFACVLLTLHVTLPVRADNRGVQIFELIAGVNADSSAQAIVLRLRDGTQALWGPPSEGAESRLELVFEDAAGTERGRYSFPSDAPIGLPDSDGFLTVLVATATFASLPGGPRADFELPAGLIAAVGGKVCLRSSASNGDFPVNLCLSYGEYAGDTEADTAEPPNPAGPPASAIETIGVSSLRRVSSLEAFGELQANADFEVGAIEARNSAGAVATFEESSLVDQGRTLFFAETFAGNGRTCGTCHLEDSAFALAPADIDELPPDDPLFVADVVPELSELENSCLVRGSHGLILEHIDGFANPPLFRGSPALFHLALTAPYGLSGEFEDLRSFFRQCRAAAFSVAPFS